MLNKPKYMLHFMNGKWCVQDEFDQIMNSFDSRSEARNFIKDLLAIDQARAYRKQFAIPIDPDPIQDHDDESESEPDLESESESNSESNSESESESESFLLETRTRKVMSPTRKGKLSKAGAIRQKIAQAVEAKLDQQTVIDWAVEELKMSKGQARSYVVGNWHRV